MPSAEKGGVGVSPCGRNTKLSDDFGRPLALVSTSGQAANCRVAELLPHLVPAGAVVLADLGYDTNAVRSDRKARDTTPNISPKSNRRWKPCFRRDLYRRRNAYQCKFKRLKDFRQIATRHDKLEVNILAANHLAATIYYRSWVPALF